MPKEIQVRGRGLAALAELRIQNRSPAVGAWQPFAHYCGSSSTAEPFIQDYHSIADVIYSQGHGDRSQKRPQDEPPGAVSFFLEEPRATLERG